MPVSHSTNRRRALESGVCRATTQRDQMRLTKSISECQIAGVQLKLALAQPSIPSTASLISELPIAHWSILTFSKLESSIVVRLEKYSIMQCDVIYPSS